MSQYLAGVSHPDDSYSPTIETHSVCTDENPAKSSNGLPPVSIFDPAIVIKLLSAIRSNISNAPVASPQESCYSPVAITQEAPVADSKLDLLQGTLDLMVLQTLSTIGPLHGYGVARRIEQVSGNEVLLNQGTIYASLVRLQQRGWISAEWGTSDNNRKAKFYSITKRGRKQLTEDAAYWQRISTVMSRVLSIPSPDEGLN